MGAGHLSLLSRHAFWCTCRRKGQLHLVLFVSESNTNRSNLDFPFLRQVDPNHPRECRFWGVLLGGIRGIEIENVFLKRNRVGCGRTELSLRLHCTQFSAIIWAWSQGSGSSRGVVRGGFSCFLRGPKIREKNSLNFSVKIGTVFLKKLGSDLVVQSSR